jgi:hypothetical protein
MSLQTILKPEAKDDDYLDVYVNKLNADQAEVKSMEIDEIKADDLLVNDASITTLTYENGTGDVLTLNDTLNVLDTINAGAINLTGFGNRGVRFVQTEQKTVVNTDQPTSLIQLAFSFGSLELPPGYLQRGATYRFTVNGGLSTTGAGEEINFQLIGINDGNQYNLSTTNNLELFDLSLLGDDATYLLQYYFTVVDDAQQIETSVSFSYSKPIVTGGQLYDGFNTFDIVLGGQINPALPLTLDLLCTWDNQSTENACSVNNCFLERIF